MHGGRVTPDRIIVPQPKPHDAPPGVVPYARFVQAQNQIEAIEESEIESTPTRIQRGTDRTDFSTFAKILPKLGILPPVAQSPEVASEIRQVQQQVVPATGRIIDAYC